MRAGTGTVRLSTADGVTTEVVADSSGVPASDDNVLVVSRTIDVNGTALTLVGTSSQARLTDSLASLYRGLWIAIPLAAVVTALMAGLATSRALRPVGAITELADSIGGTMNGARVPVPDTGDEIEHLAVTVNAMLERIEEGRASQRQFTSDAAHELRTPLMALQGELELAEAHGAERDDAFLLPAAVADHAARRAHRRPRAAVHAGRVATARDRTGLVAADRSRRSRRRRPRRRRRRRRPVGGPRPRTRVTSGTQPARQRPAAHCHQGGGDRVRCRRQGVVARRRRRSGCGPRAARRDVPQVRRGSTRRAARTGAAPVSVSPSSPPWPPRTAEGSTLSRSPLGGARLSIWLPEV